MGTEILTVIGITAIGSRPPTSVRMTGRAALVRAGRKNPVAPLSARQSPTVDRTSEGDVHPDPPAHAAIAVERADGTVGEQAEPVERQPQAGAPGQQEPILPGIGTG